MTQINKAQRGAILQFGKLVNKAKLASNRLGRIFTGEAAAEKKLNKLAKQKILQQTGSWRPTQKMREINLEGKKQSIRDAKAMRSAASKAELKWMQENSDKATKVYKSGAREFGGDENKLALLKVRQEAMKPFISDEASKIRRNRALGTLGLAGLVTAGYNFEPTNFYVHDLYKGASYSVLSPRGLPVTLGVTRKNLGNNIDKMRYQYNIPLEKVDSMRNVYNKYSEIIRKERENKA